jgi:hypothetical protein
MITIKVIAILGEKKDIKCFPFLAVIVKFNFGKKSRGTLHSKG